MSAAFCWRGGQIGFGRTVPEGALPLCKGPMKRIRPIVEAIARHAYDGVTLLVPGLPEADTDDQALAAVVEFHAQIDRRLVRAASKMVTP